MKKISINELFSGIGAQHKALLNLGYDVDVVGISEIDKYAIQSYEAIYGKTKNYGDISKVERLDYADMWTYSFPCTDISVAGKQEGINENTRSGLLYQVQRLLDVAKNEGTLPKYLLLENVKNLVGKKFKSQFDNWLFYLESLGYVNYWQVLNAKDYGIPQNRERVFVVSVRSDIPKLYQFPQKEELKLRLKDMLEDNVDENFYLNPEKIKGFWEYGNLNRSDKILVKEATKKGYATATIGDSINIEQPNSKTRRGRVGKEVAQTLTTSPQQCVIDKVMQVGNIVNTGNWDNPTVPIEPSINKVGNIYPSGGENGNIYTTDGISPTLKSGQGVVGNGIGSNNAPKIIEETVCGALRIEKIKVPEIVRVRKFEVDTDKLKVLLKEHKTLTCKEISEKLEIPQTKVEHWFRQDKCFAIPDTEYWYQLKELLKIETDEFDAAITTFEEKEGTFEKSNRCYLDTGISPTLTATFADEKVITNLRIRKLTPKECWRLMGFDDEDFDKAKQSGVSNSQLYKQAGNSIVVNVLEKIFKNLEL